MPDRSVEQPSRERGWHRDGSGRERWWDGSTWTLHVRGLEAPPSSTNRRAGRASAAFSPQRGNSGTLSSWTIALAPLLQVGVHLVAMSLGAHITWATLGAIAALTTGATTLLAWYDGAQLRARGYEGTASPWWTLVAPAAYLFFRGQRVNLRSYEGFEPFWAHLLLVALLGLLVVMVTVFGGAFAHLALLPR